MTVHLQGIGAQPAKKAKDIQPGDVLMWNFGYTSKVLEIVKETASQIVVRLESNDSGNVNDRRMGKERLVALA